MKNTPNGERIRPFARQGYYVQLDNFVVDEVMPRLSGNALKILLLILRQTRGFNKASDSIAYSQIMAKTGIKSRATVSKALEELTTSKTFGTPLVLIKFGVASGATSHEATRYALNRNFEILADSQTPKNASNHSSKIKPRGSKNEPSHGSKNELTKRVIEKKTLQRSARDTRAENDDAQNSTRLVSQTATPATAANDARHAPFSSAQDPRFDSAHFVAVAAACGADLQTISHRGKCEMAVCAVTLEDAGYSPADIERAARVWPLANAPTPRQLQDRISALLNPRPLPATGANSHRNPNGTNLTNPDAYANPRFPSAAERKSAKWARAIAEELGSL